MRLWLNWIELRVSAPAVVGSNPTRRATSYETPTKPWFVEVLEFKNTTLLQLYKDFIETDTSYLQKIKDIYYLIYKFNGKIIKKSLRSSNLKYCNIQKLKMIKVIKEELGLEFAKLNDMLKISIQAEEGDDPDEVEKIRKKAIIDASKSLQNGKIASVTSINQSKMSINEAYKNFINNVKSTNEKISEATLENYNSAYSYIKLFINETDSISELNTSFWTYLQETLTKTPKIYSKTPYLLEKGIEKSIIDNEKLKTDLEINLKKAGQNKVDIDKIKFKYQSKILDTLSNTTINKHFGFYSKFMSYLEKKELMKNTIRVDTLSEEESPKQTFLYKELKELFNYKSKTNLKNDYEDEEYQNIFKFAFLSGMRRGEILKITKDTVVRADGVLCIDIQEGKTKNSIRLVPVSEDMKKIMDLQFEKSKNGYLFFDNDIRFNQTESIERNIGKRLNRKIDNLLKSYGYVDKSIKSFHSLRANFIQELYKQYEQRNVGSELYIKMLVGHKEVSKNITFTTYNKSQVSIDILRDCIYTVSLDLVYEAKKENIVEKIKEYGSVKLDF